MNPDFFFTISYICSRGTYTYTNHVDHYIEGYVISLTYLDDNFGNVFN